MDKPFAKMKIFPVMLIALRFYCGFCQVIVEEPDSGSLLSIEGEETLTFRQYLNQIRSLQKRDTGNDDTRSFYDKTQEKLLDMVAKDQLPKETKAEVKAVIKAVKSRFKNKRTSKNITALYKKYQTVITTEVVNVLNLTHQDFTVSRTRYCNFFKKRCNINDGNVSSRVLGAGDAASSEHEGNASASSRANEISQTSPSTNTMNLSRRKSKVFLRDTTLEKHADAVTEISSSNKNLTDALMSATSDARYETSSDDFKEEANNVPSSGSIQESSFSENTFSVSTSKANESSATSFLVNWFAKNNTRTTINEKAPIKVATTTDQASPSAEKQSTAVFQDQFTPEITTEKTVISLERSLGLQPQFDNIPEAYKTTDQFSSLIEADSTISTATKSSNLLHDSVLDAKSRSSMVPNENKVGFDSSSQSNSQTIAKGILQYEETSSRTKMNITSSPSPNVSHVTNYPKITSVTQTGAPLVNASLTPIMKVSVVSNFESSESMVNVSETVASQDETSSTLSSKKFLSASPIYSSFSITTTVSPSSILTAAPSPKATLTPQLNSNNLFTSAITASSKTMSDSNSNEPFSTMTEPSHKEPLNLSTLQGARMSSSSIISSSHVVNNNSTNSPEKAFSLTTSSIIPINLKSTVVKLQAQNFTDLHTSMPFIEITNPNTTASSISRLETIAKTPEATSNFETTLGPSHTSMLNSASFPESPEKTSVNADSTQTTSSSQANDSNAVTEIADSIEAKHLTSKIIKAYLSTLPELISNLAKIANLTDTPKATFVSKGITYPHTSPSLLKSETIVKVTESTIPWYETTKGPPHATSLYNIIAASPSKVSADLKIVSTSKTIIPEISTKSSAIPNSVSDEISISNSESSVEATEFFKKVPTFGPKITDSYETRLSPPHTTSSSNTYAVKVTDASETVPTPKTTIIRLPTTLLSFSSSSLDTTVSESTLETESLTDTTSLPMLSSSFFEKVTVTDETMPSIEVAYPHTTFSSMDISESTVSPVQSPETIPSLTTTMSSSHFTVSSTFIIKNTKAPITTPVPETITSQPHASSSSILNLNSVAKQNDSTEMISTSKAAINLSDTSSFSLLSSNFFAKVTKSPETSSTFNTVLSHPDITSTISTRLSTKVTYAPKIIRHASTTIIAPPLSTSLSTLLSLESFTKATDLSNSTSAFAKSQPESESSSIHYSGSKSSPFTTSWRKRLPHSSISEFNLELFFSTQSPHMTVASSIASNIHISNINTKSSVSESFADRTSKTTLTVPLSSRSTNKTRLQPSFSTQTTVSSPKSSQQILKSSSKDATQFLFSDTKANTFSPSLPFLTSTLTSSMSSLFSENLFATLASANLKKISSLENSEHGSKNSSISSTNELNAREGSTPYEIFFSLNDTTETFTFQPETSLFTKSPYSSRQISTLNSVFTNLHLNKTSDSHITNATKQTSSSTFDSNKNSPMITKASANFMTSSNQPLLTSKTVSPSESSVSSPITVNQTSPNSFKMIHFFDTKTTNVPSNYDTSQQDNFSNSSKSISFISNSKYNSTESIIASTFSTPFSLTAKSNDSMSTENTTKLFQGVTNAGKFTQTLANKTYTSGKIRNSSVFQNPVITSIESVQKVTPSYTVKNSKLISALTPQPSTSTRFLTSTTTNFWPQFPPIQGYHPLPPESSDYDARYIISDLLQYISNVFSSIRRLILANMH